MLVLKKGGKKPLSIKIEMTFLLVNLEFDSVSQDEGRCKKIQQQRNIWNSNFGIDNRHGMGEIPKNPENTQRLFFLNKQE